MALAIILESQYVCRTTGGKREKELVRGKIAIDLTLVGSCWLSMVA